MSLNLDRTCSITVSTFCVGPKFWDLPLVDTASFLGADTVDIIDLPFMFKRSAALRLHLNSHHVDFPFRAVGSFLACIDFTRSAADAPSSDNPYPTSRT